MILFFRGIRFSYTGHGALVLLLVALGVCFFPFDATASVRLRVIIAIPIACALATLVVALYRASKFRERYHSLKDQLEKQKVLTKRKERLANYFDRVLKDAADIIFTLDVEGFILKFNLGAEAILGFSQQGIVGTPFKTMLLDNAEAEEIFALVRRDVRVQNRETRMRAKDGHEIDVSMSVSEMRDEANRIMGMVITCKDVTERKRLEKELIEKNALLESLAITDNLSGLYNVRHFHDEINKTFTRLRRGLYGRFALLLIDIDKFKELNDTQGHKAGDAVIEKMGEIIRVCIRKDLDSAFRYGGDEFVVILPDADEKSSVVVADRIITKFAAFRFGRTSLSVGITAAIAEDTEETLVHRSDFAMYQ
ncbi:MAG: hypothetical protein A2487_04055, partial [Candidatus Raymondbacteria bacterium RifOxyC12_full_50_8]